MKSYRSKSIILVLIFVIAFGIYFSTNRKKDNPAPTTVKTSEISSNSTVRTTADSPKIDPKEFLNQFAGEWKSKDDSELLIFREVGQSIQLEQPSDDYKINVNVSDYQAAYSHWFLLPVNGEEFQYHVTQLSEEELSIYTSTTRPDTEGTSKPETFYRVK